MHVSILTSCKHAVIIQCHLYPQHCNSHFNGTADILTARSSLLSTDTSAYYKIKIKKTPTYNMTLHLPGYFLFYLQCFAFSTFATIQENFVSFRKFNKKFKTKMAAKHFLSKAWSLSFERIWWKIRDLVKNLLLISNQGCG